MLNYHMCPVEFERLCPWTALAANLECISANAWSKRPTCELTIPMSNCRETYLLLQLPLILDFLVLGVLLTDVPGLQNALDNQCQLVSILVLLFGRCQCQTCIDSDFEVLALEQRVDQGLVQCVCPWIDATFFGYKANGKVRVQ